MPRRRGLHPSPRDYLAPGATWPAGPLVSDAPPEAHLLQAISQRLRDETRGKSKREIARQCDLAAQTVFNILNGNTWSDAPTIARLEYHIDIDLWGTEHKDRHATLTWRASHRPGRKRP